MSREILFRGKDLETGKWLYGSFIKTPNHAHISTSGEAFPAKVEPKTIGQYTGLIDKNGAKIFEGDIVRCVSRLDYTNMIVIFEDGEFRMVKCEDYKTYIMGNGYFSVRCFHKEVIGNIYDNPELVKA